MNSSLNIFCDYLSTLPQWKWIASLLLLAWLLAVNCWSHGVPGLVFWPVRGCFPHLSDNWTTLACLKQVRWCNRTDMRLPPQMASTHLTVLRVCVFEWMDYFLPHWNRCSCVITLSCGQMYSSHQSGVCVVRKGGSVVYILRNDKSNCGGIRMC